VSLELLQQLTDLDSLHWLEVIQLLLLVQLDHPFLAPCPMAVQVALEFHLTLLQTKDLSGTMDRSAPDPVHY